MRVKYFPDTDTAHVEFTDKYDDFSKSVRGNDILDSRTTLLIYLATSMAVGCDH
jgi:hypothetical protein